MAREKKSETLELIKSQLHQLPANKLPVVLDFIEFLRHKAVDPDLREAMLYAQPLLAEDWLSPEEEEAWKDL